MGEPVPWRAAWTEALYGTRGFYRAGAGPAAHFRTSVHASPLFADAVLRLVREAGLNTVVDLGAGGGELLVSLRRQAPDLRLYGVDVGLRPADLPAAIEWTVEVPYFDGLLLANEWLDNIPCDVVEGTPAGPRLVLVEPAGRECLGEPPASPDAAWLDRWWPLPSGQRAEVGLARDAAWAGAVGRLGRGLAIAVDYAHGRGSRPAQGSLAGYRGGRRVAPVPDGSCDLTAHVALDACAAAAPGSVLLTQRAALHALGVSGRRPALGTAGYAAALQAASEAAELTDPGGLGGFGWLVHAKGIALPATFTTAREATAAPG